MRRIASHRVFWKELYPLSYVELTDEGVFQGVYPLREETPATEFYDGLLLPVPQGAPLSYPLTPEEIRRSGLTENVSTGDKIHLYRIHGESIYRHFP
ncbi:MAG: hypothetical protein LBQ73_06940 [Tannerellaceae bacterium]|jgi:hypothetical protein|nr:hypothetical protein [Tannerellaceae bacterium]